MMKTVMTLLAVLALTGTFLTGCKKDQDNYNEEYFPNCSDCPTIY